MATVRNFEVITDTSIVPGIAVSENYSHKRRTKSYNHSLIAVAAISV
jgi:hypothetical protein